MVFGKFGTDRQERINYDRMRKYRLERAKEMMDKYRMGALVTWNPTNMRYIASYVGPGYVVLPRNGDPYVYVHLLDGGRRVEGMPWLAGRTRPSVATGAYDTPPTEERTNFVKEIATIMDEHGVKNEPLILEGDMGSLRLQESFREAGINAVYDSRVMDGARLIKNQDEIECLRIACANAEVAFAAIRDAIRPGVTECELVGIGAETLYRLGADAVSFSMMSGERTNPLRYDFTDRQICPGDMVVVPVWDCSFQGYQTCYWRAFCCGKATAEQKELYEDVRSMLYAGLSAIKAGATALDIVEKWPADPRRWGHEKWGEESVRDSLVVHSIGLDRHEWYVETRPYLSRDRLKEIVFEENMTLSVDANMGKKGGKDGIRLEEQIVVTKDGYELLTKFPIDELIECGV